ncbi:hypothetical protein HK102_008202, partial [Quaeritorhiza haematococci]
IDTEIANNQGDFYVSLAEGLLTQKPATFKVCNILFGMSPQQAIQLASEVEIPITLDPKAAAAGPQFVQVGALDINILPPGATIPVQSKLPLNFGVGTIMAEASLRGSRIATANLPNTALNEGQNTVATNLDLDFGGILGSIPGGFAAIVSGNLNNLDARVSNVNIMGMGGQPVSWLNTAMSGKEIKVDLNALLAGAAALVGPEGLQNLMGVANASSLAGVGLNGTSIGPVKRDVTVPAPGAAAEKFRLRPRKIDSPLRV